MYKQNKETSYIRKGVLSLLTVGMVASMHQPENVMAEGDVGTKTSEVSITFVMPDDPEEVAKLEKQKEEFQDKQVQEIRKAYINAPGDYSTVTTFVYKDSTVIFRSDLN